MVLVQDDNDGIEHVVYYFSRNLLDTETYYAHVEKLALATVCAIQRFRHYKLLHTTMVISDCKSMTYILSRQLLGRKYSKWIVILQEFDLEFTTAKCKKSLVFAELLFSLPSAIVPSQLEDHIPDQTLFLISTLDPCTHNLSFAAWVIYDPHGESVDLQGVCLGCTTNNVTEYSAVIELLTEAINLGIRALDVNLDSQLVAY
eukprot:PITA_23849